MFQSRRSCLFLLISHVTFAVCSESFQNDNLVSINGNVTSSEGTTTRRESEESVAEIFNEFASPKLWELMENDSECKNHVDIVRREAGKLNLWALKMLDASAKLPSGILRGNLNQFGDFDECLSSEGRFENELIRGKYCLANIKIKIAESKPNEKIKILDSLIHSHRMLTNELKDQGHRIPRFETFNWGVCLPASCTKNEIEKAFNDYLQRAFTKSPFEFQVSIDDEVCYVKENQQYSPVKVGVIFIFLAVLSLIMFGTLMDMKKFSSKNPKLVQTLQCFSLKKNWDLLVKTDFPEDDIKCLHGARFLNAIALLLSHKQIAMLFNPTPNRTEMSEAFGKAWTMIGRSAILYTDSFIMFSGLLASYSIIKDLDNKKGINFKQKLINRIVRFTPNLFAVIFFCTFIMDSMGSGPHWGLVVNKYTNLCKKNMWRNFLYIHNHFGFENMCLTHTHQLGIDMQLFLVSPIFIYAMWKSPKVGSLFLFLVSVASTWLRYDVTYREGLSTILHFGISVERLWKTANLSYILPTHRLTVYLLGVYLGYYLRRGGKNLKFSSLQATTGWILAVSAGLIAVFGPYQASFKEYNYDVNDAAWFNAFAPVLWTIFLFWTIIACVNDHGGFFCEILSWKYFQIFTKISYAVYLTQFPVFFYNVGTERSLQYYKGFHSLFDLSEYCIIFIASIVLTLTFDIPFQELKKIIIPKTTSPNAEVMKKEKEDDEEESIEVNDEEIEGVRKRRIQSFGT